MQDKTIYQPPKEARDYADHIRQNTRKINGTRYLVKASSGYCNGIRVR